MPKLRICSFNIEWMNDWFTPDATTAEFRSQFADDDHNAIDTDKTAQRAADTIRDIDPHVLAIQEGPSRLAELGLFVHDYLNDDYDFFLSDAGGQQKLGVLFRPDAVDSAQLAPSAEIAGLVDDWSADVDGDGFIDLYKFTRTPLVVNLTVGGNLLQVIVAHTKSNFVNRGRAMWENPATQQNYIVSALKNRRRISTEGMRIRRYLDQRLANDADESIVVLGDLNDGPGLDYFEELYLTHNVTDIIVGSAFAPELIFDHAQHEVAPAERYTAVFEDFVPTPEEKKLLLDHIILSPGLSRPGGLRKVAGSGAVRHAEYDAHVDNNGRRRDDRPSDHRPVSVELEF